MALVILGGRVAVPAQTSQAIEIIGDWQHFAVSQIA
jgi:hypothetical protein